MGMQQTMLAQKMADKMMNTPSNKAKMKKMMDKEKAAEAKEKEYWAKYNADVEAKKVKKQAERDARTKSGNPTIRDRFMNMLHKK